jgi:xanthine/uracil/vitamin C permease (AzgA family)
MDMRKNKLGYLGFLGFTGLLGVVNVWLFAFFSFFTLFVFLKGDERTDRNIGRASRNAFIFDTILIVFSLAYVTSSKTYEAMPMFVALLSQGLTLFSLSYWYYDNKED